MKNGPKSMKGKITVKLRLNSENSEFISEQCGKTGKNNNK